MRARMFKVNDSSALPIKTPLPNSARVMVAAGCVSGGAGSGATARAAGCVAPTWGAWSAGCEVGFDGAEAGVTSRLEAVALAVGGSAVAPSAVTAVALSAAIAGGVGEPDSIAGATWLELGCRALVAAELDPGSRSAVGVGAGWAKAAGEPKRTQVSNECDTRQRIVARLSYTFAKM